MYFVVYSLKDSADINKFCALTANALEKFQQKMKKAQQRNISYGQIQNTTDE